MSANTRQTGGTTIPSPYYFPPHAHVTNTPELVTQGEYPPDFAEHEGGVANLIYETDKTKGGVTEHLAGTTPAPSAPPRDVTQTPPSPDYIPTPDSAVAAGGDVSVVVG